MTKIYTLKEVTFSVLVAAGEAGIVVQSKDGKTLFNVRKLQPQVQLGIEGSRGIYVQRQGSDGATQHNTTAEAVAFMGQY